MKKNTQTILLIAGAGALAYYFLKNKSGARLIQSESEAESTEETGKGAETMPTQTEVDAVIDTVKTGMPVVTAINQAKQLATALKDANIIIKTPKGQPNISVRKGAKKRLKKRATRKAKRIMRRAKRYGDCTKIKSSRRRKRCEISQQKAGIATGNQLSRFKINF